MAEKATAAFVLSLIGGIIYFLIGALVAVVAAFIHTIPGVGEIAIAGLAVAAVGGIGLVSGVLIIIGSAMMNSSVRSRVRTGSIIVLVFTLVGAPFTAAGLIVGLLLGIVGSILGLTWKPAVEAPTPPPPASP